MSYEVEHINVKIYNKKFSQPFCDYFNKILGEGNYLYNYDCDIGFLFSDNFERAEDYITISIEGEPIFRFDEAGEQIDSLLFKFIKDFPDVKIDVEYYNESGYAVFNRYSYVRNKLHIRKAFSENSPGMGCYECGKLFDAPIISIKRKELQNGYICPFCGENLDYDIDEETEYEFVLSNNEWHRCGN